MRIEFLGTGGFHPNDRRETACLMIPEIGLVFDAGTAAYRIARHLQTDSLDLFLTHAHLDHICGLTYLITLTLSKRVREIRLYGRASFLTSVRDRLFDEAVFPVDPPFVFSPLEDTGSHVLASGGVMHWQVLPSHPGSSTAYRLDFNGRKLAYVTDTTVDGTYDEFIAGADLLVHECYYPDTKQDWAERTGHTYATELARLAAKVQVKRVVAVHPDPQADADDPIGLAGMQAIFPEMTLGQDETGFELTP